MIFFRTRCLQTEDNSVGCRRPDCRLFLPANEQHGECSGCSPPLVCPTLLSLGVSHPASSQKVGQEQRPLLGSERGFPGQDICRALVSERLHIRQPG